MCVITSFDFKIHSFNRGSKYEQTVGHKSAARRFYIQASGTRTSTVPVRNYRTERFKGIQQNTHNKTQILRETRRRQTHNKNFFSYKFIINHGTGE